MDLGGSPRSEKQQSPRNWPQSYDLTSNLLNLWWLSLSHSLTLQLENNTEAKYWFGRHNGSLSCLGFSLLLFISLHTTRQCQFFSSMIEPTCGIELHGKTNNTSSETTKTKYKEKFIVEVQEKKLQLARLPLTLGLLTRPFRLRRRNWTGTSSPRNINRSHCFWSWGSTGYPPPTRRHPCSPFLHLPRVICGITAEQAGIDMSTGMTTHPDKRIELTTSQELVAHR